MLDHEHYRGLLSRVKTRRRRHSVSRAATEQSSESYTSYGLGSGTNGTVISVIPCSNNSEGGIACHKEGLLGCAQAIYFLLINVPETNYIFISVFACQGGPDINDLNRAHLPLVCPQYCSDYCQRQHWSKHRLDCEHPYLDSQWEPEWVVRNREPLFSTCCTLPPSSSSDPFKNPGYPAYDCLQLQRNEVLANRDYKICIVGALVTLFL